MSKRHSNIFQWTATVNKLIESYKTLTIYNDARSYKKVFDKLSKNIPIIMKITWINPVLRFLMRCFNNV